MAAHQYLPAFIRLYRERLGLYIASKQHEFHASTFSPKAFASMIISPSFLHAITSHKSHHTIIYEAQPQQKSYVASHSNLSHAFTSP
ncbi:hypothetical protein EYC84_005716 [Monilinia fructicola]|uniref:Uncharacterized protein n=1 Tax=Monilinia fructicola TaxID=38448 RepID=A0A5M9JZX5_MONFR|nr:hypothetical protein EYC84_005716 [Monilinia fructicola]